jgi:hypothetical protein
MKLEGILSGMVLIILCMISMGWYHARTVGTLYEPAHKTQTVGW